MHQKLFEVLRKRKPFFLTDFTLPYKPREAGVAVLCHDDQGEIKIILTKRTEQVAHHKGQICFPGGVKDDVDTSLWETAIRESWEEIGVGADQVKLVGELGQVVTPTGFSITPFVGWLAGPLTFTLSSDEIAEIFSVPVSHLLDPANFQYVTRVYDGIKVQDPVFTYGDHHIWGATGRIIKDLLDVWRSAQEY